MRQQPVLDISGPLLTEDVSILFISLVKMEKLLVKEEHV
jgi:hypothetical protein